MTPLNPSVRCWNGPELSETLVVIPLMRSLVLTSCLVALAGCASSNPGNLKKTAMADLGCPAKQLTIDQLQKSKAGSTFLVTGCGKTAQYQVTKKAAVRTTEITAYVAPPPPAPPPPPTAQQQADFDAFMQQHDERHAQGVAEMQKSMDASTSKPLPSQQVLGAAPPPPPPPPARPEEQSAPVRASSSESGYVCLNGSYFACPNVESTAALGAYGQCKFKCAMGGNCSACVVGAGEQCKREPARDSSCN